MSETIDKKYIQFKNTNNIFRSIMRVGFAGIVFIVFYEASKLFIPVYILEGDTFITYLCVILRNCVSLIFSLGLTPFIYKYNILKVKD